MKFSKRLINHIAHKYYSKVTDDIDEQKLLAEEDLFAAQQYFNEHLTDIENIEDFFNDWFIPFNAKNYHMFIDNYREVNGLDRYDDRRWKMFEKIGYIVCLFLLIFAAVHLLMVR